jgi:hypothetical protein
MKSPLESFKPKSLEAESTLEDESKRLQEDLKDPNYLPSYKKVKPIIDRFTDKRGNWLLSETEGKDLNQFMRDEHIYEIFTEEYINGLSEYLKTRIETLSKTEKIHTILEVGAGNGKLTHLLTERLRDLIAEKNIKLIATDSGDWKVTNSFQSVEPLGVKDALAKYHPEIVISSWMPPQIDWAADFRNNDSVQEYILIGPTGPTGSDDTWMRTREEYAEIYGDKELAARMQPTSFNRDNFAWIQHPGLGKFQLSRLDVNGCAKTSADFRSETNSFIKERAGR